MAGTPIPQGSKKAFVRGGRVSLVEANPKHKSWRSAVTAACSSVWTDREPLDGPVEVEIVFVFERPKSVKREWMTVKPDIDKLVRAIFDAVSDAGVWSGDQQVVRLICQKRYVNELDDQPGAQILIRHAV